MKNINPSPAHFASEKPTKNTDDNRKIPKLKDVLLFRIKTSLLQTQRAWQNRWHQKILHHPIQEYLVGCPVLSESITPLWGENSNDPIEKKWTLGKIHNLRIAARALHGLEIPAGAIFSFWKQLGKLTRSQGYVVGREIRQGCIIPTLGGGICQLSNALYDAALKANANIIERHGHTVVIPGSLAEVKRDATVFWNYVDLRFSLDQDFRIELEISSRDLILRFLGKNPKQKKSSPQQSAIESSPILNKTSPPLASVNDCFSCGEISCSRSVPKTNETFGKTAFLVDELWPEYDDWIQKEKKKSDLLFIPFNGKKWGKSNYAWNMDGFEKIYLASLTTLRRAYAFRQISSHGAVLQQKTLEWDEKLAHAYTKHLSFEIEHLVVSQNLLPFLWQQGVLGGRTFDVLMTRLPASNIENILNATHKRHPTSQTLHDFRAPQKILNGEDQALNAAQRIITPHSKIATLFPQKTKKLPWKLPVSQEAPHQYPLISKNKQSSVFEVLFPYPTLGRKGAYELRELVRQFDFKLWIHPKNFEGENFWKGLNVQLWNTKRIPETIDLILFPAHIEHKPRNILLFASRGFPVAASEACGITDIQGIKVFSMENPEDLKNFFLKNIPTLVSRLTE